MKNQEYVEQLKTIMLRSSDGKKMFEGQFQHMEK